MSIRIGINGFGRIGRAVFRILASRSEEFEESAINDIADSSILANLLKYDTMFGIFPGKVETEDGGLRVNGKTIRVTNERDPEHIPWQQGEVGVVLESSGKFRSREGMQKHLAVA
jgi:glyceraldehyde 3-phosphate dehydrogenase